MGSPKLPPAARGIPARVHPEVFEAAHRAAQHHRPGRLLQGYIYQPSVKLDDAPEPEEALT
jgi:hypothetical protein